MTVYNTGLDKIAHFGVDSDLYLGCANLQFLAVNDICRAKSSVLTELAVNTFANLGALFITVYYSVAYLLAAYMLKKPFGKLMEAVKDQEAQNHE